MYVPEQYIYWLNGKAELDFLAKYENYRKMLAFLEADKKIVNNPNPIFNVGKEIKKTEDILAVLNHIWYRYDTAMGYIYSMDHEERCQYLDWVIHDISINGNPVTDEDKYYLNLLKSALKHIEEI